MTKNIKILSICVGTLAVGGIVGVGGYFTYSYLKQIRSSTSNNHANNVVVNKNDFNHKVSRNSISPSLNNNDRTITNKPDGNESTSSNNSINKNHEGATSSSLKINKSFDEADKNDVNNSLNSGKPNNKSQVVEGDNKPPSQNQLQVNQSSEQIDQGEESINKERLTTNINNNQEDKTTIQKDDYYSLVPQEYKRNGNLRLLSWNVKNFGSKSINNNVDSSKFKNIVQTIKILGADIVGLVEINWKD
ncbi:hypothetical protein [Mycoplasma sp. E35C]|uniref:hypothetical protein n=1 Tax=Mycoplasma sp. E35C TaxID=2801918 RepID=UPI001CA46469|nr:hypothetical protein [Mycoplasma sp. E35C]QZX49159.1 hypothetical protein JJE79_00055 [Mycoplasma sp. E35C]